MAKERPTIVASAARSVPLLADCSRRPKQPYSPITSYKSTLSPGLDRRPFWRSVVKRPPMCVTPRTRRGCLRPSGRFCTLCLSSSISLRYERRRNGTANGRPRGIAVALWLMRQPHETSQCFRRVPPRPSVPGASKFRRGGRGRFDRRSDTDRRRVDHDRDRVASKLHRPG